MLLLAGSGYSWLLLDSSFAVISWGCFWLLLAAPGCYLLFLACSQLLLPGCSRRSWLLLASPSCCSPCLHSRFPLSIKFACFFVVIAAAVGSVVVVIAIVVNLFLLLLLLLLLFALVTLATLVGLVVLVFLVDLVALVALLILIPVLVSLRYPSCFF